MDFSEELKFDNSTVVESFYLRSGKNAHVFQKYSDKLFCVLLHDDVFYKKVLLKNVLVKEIKQIATLEDAEKIAVEQLLYKGNYE